MKNCLIIILLLVVSVDGFARNIDSDIKTNIYPSVCYGSNKSLKSFVEPPLILKGSSLLKSNIIVDFVDFPEEAKPAFMYAVDIWKGLVYSPMPIRIRAKWKILGFGVLGSCSPANFFYNFNSTQIWDCYYPVALAEKMMGKELNHSNDYEIDASFNKNVKNWYFGIDGNTPEDKYDFASTVLHELCHGLGFHGFIYSKQGIGGYGSGDGLATVFDHYVVNKNAERLINTKIFPNPSSKLNDELTSGWLAFDTKLLTGLQPRLYAPSPWEDGSSIYHLDRAIYPEGGTNSLMIHSMDMGTAIHDPGPNTMSIMYDMGWKSISINHKPLKDIEFVTEPVVFEAQILSDYELDTNKLFLVYSINKSSKIDSLQLKPTDQPNIFSTSFKPAQNTVIQYYIKATDNKNRTFVYPSSAPYRYFGFSTGPDKISPSIVHEPIKSMLLSSPSTTINADVFDNTAIKSVKVEYFINGGIVKELSLSNDSVDRFVGTLAFAGNTVKGGDVVSYRIVATDASMQGNIGRLPLSGYYTFKIESIYPAVNKYVTNFNAANGDFVFSGFSISSPPGFYSPALNSEHPYQSPDLENQHFNFTAVLRYPVVLNKNGKMSFDEIVLVEPGETDAKFGDYNFWDYVIIEGSIDGGATWKPILNGYDSNAQKSWVRLFNSSMKGNNSTAVPTSDLFVKREVNMLANGNFKEGDTLLIRFRLYSDPFSNGWGWIIDNLSIQDDGTLTTTPLLSPGEIVIFPNPADDIVNVQLNASINISKLHIGIYNTVGQLVYSNNFNVGSNTFQTAINVENFTSGLYLFVVKGENGQVITRKIQVK